jgi:hypothetical protein
MICQSFRKGSIHWLNLSAHGGMFSTSLHCTLLSTGRCSAGSSCSASHDAVPFPYCHRLNYGRECKVKNCTFVHELYLGKYW